MGDCSEIYGCRPDGGQGPSGRSHVRYKEFPHKASRVQSKGDGHPDG